MFYWLIEGKLDKDPVFYTEEVRNNKNAYQHCVAPLNYIKSY